MINKKFILKIINSYNYFHIYITKLILNPVTLKKIILLLVTVNPRIFWKIIKEKKVQILQQLDINEQYIIWIKNNLPSGYDLNKQKLKWKEFRVKPKISIVTPTFNTNIKFLIECIESVCNQTYENWELCIVDDASQNEKIREVISRYSKIYKKIKYKFLKNRKHICIASNTALKLATGKYVGFLDHDDVLSPNALYEIVRVINKYPSAEFIYSDEDKLDKDGITHIDPFFKPDWSPDYIRSINYIAHFTVIKKKLIDKVGGFHIGFEGAQDWDLFLRVTSKIYNSDRLYKLFNLKNPKIVHIPKILYSWRKSSASTSSEVYTKVKPYVENSSKKTLQVDLKTRGYQGNVYLTKSINLWRVKYKILGNPLVSIIIPTKDNYQLIRDNLTSIMEKSTYKNYEIIIIDTGSKQAEVWNLYQNINQKNNRTNVFEWKEKFNYSAVCNFGVEKSKGKHLILLNNDTKIITSDWIESMLEYSQRPYVGAVGVKLIYPNNKIQHAGIILGIKDGTIEKGVAGNAFKYIYNSDYGGYFNMINSVRNYSAVTAACLMIEKSKFIEVNGLDPIFRIAFNDVDFCLKLLSKNYVNVYTPFARLYHIESVSVGRPGDGVRDNKEFEKEVNRMIKKWKWLLDDDPFYNPNLTLERQGYNLKI